MSTPIRPLSQIYKTQLGLLTDLYQLTMGQAYFDAGMKDHEAAFSLHFRKNPFGGGFTVACGMAHTIDYLVNCFRFTKKDIAYLRSLRGNDGKPLFTPAYLQYLRTMRFTCDLDMVREGTVVFPYEPMVRVKGPIIQAQIVETALLCMNNFASLIATKSSRVRLSVGDDPYIDFGLRRAQGIDGSLMASWAAFIGGSDGTSNVLASRLFRIPAKGTFAHSWVMSFKKELDSFFKYAESMGNNSLFLVDTYNTLQGVRNAIKVGKWLAARGFKMVGIRLDSGKLGDLSIKAREMLDAEGFQDAVIFATNDLDEMKITRLKVEGAKIGAWGVGTMMITAFDQPALGGVYKLCAIREPGGEWRYCVKLSEDAIKTSIPGIQQVNRYFDRDGKILGDVIFDELRSDPINNDFIDLKTGRRINVHHFAGAGCRQLLEATLRGGKIINDAKEPAESRAHRAAEVASLPDKVKKLRRPTRYPVFLESNLHGIRQGLIAQARAEAA